MLPIVINISKEQKKTKKKTKKQQTIHKENVTDFKVGAQDNDDTMRSAPARPPLKKRCFLLGINYHLNDYDMLAFI